MYRRLAAVLVAAALSLTVAGCSDTPSSPPSAPTQDAAGGPTAPRADTSPSAASSTADVLPAARAYVDAVNRADLDALVAAFAPDGQILDVSRRITGQDAIRRWADNEVIGGTLRVDGVTAIAPDTQRLRVHWAPSGSDGWAADYTFTIRGDRVVLADLQYAN